MPVYRSKPVGNAGPEAAGNGAGEDGEIVGAGLAAKTKKVSAKARSVESVTADISGGHRACRLRAKMPPVKGGSSSYRSEVIFRPAFRKPEGSMATPLRRTS